MNRKIIFAIVIFSLTIINASHFIYDSASNDSLDSYIKMALAEGETSQGSCVQVYAYNDWYEGCSHIECETYDCWNGSYNECIKGVIFHYWNCEGNQADVDNFTNPDLSCTS